jgi:cytochrome c
VFGRCSACHAVGPNAENKAGPILNGIIGQKAGEVPGYSFSDAMKNSGIVWDDTTLATFLKSPRKAVPGTKMTFAGLPKAQDIANVIAYLKTFALDGNPATAAPAN